VLINLSGLVAIPRIVTAVGWTNRPGAQPRATIAYHERRQVPGVRKPFDVAEARILNTTIAPGDDHIHRQGKCAVPIGGIQTRPASYEIPESFRAITVLTQLNLADVE
jgi:hypothetical protein